MVKTIILSNFTAERNALLLIVRKKISETKITSHNEVFHNKYKVQLNSITELLNAIEAKFKRCEILFHTYFEDIDHAILSNNVTSLPFDMDCTYFDGTAQLKYNFKVDDKNFYKEIIDLNFQSFILQIASLYENLVFLAEILIKKVIVYVREPLSSPLLDYLNYLKRLVNLGYRQNDKLNICINSHNAFFDKYLLQINNLRNRFIHGYSINLNSDGYNYYVDKMDKTPFLQNSPDLMIDIFAKEILDNTNFFIRELLTALKHSASHHTKSIPV
ncbi:hypothetical protein [Flavobacterium sp. ZS1P14]|uniref:hypothetical protein n=1 Tax=Flavobacterium sp. ZS1P14 TaxID=3401729 RepID=UPI003AAF279E